MLRVSIFGAGVMGRRHARVFALCESVRIVGVVDVDKDAAQSLASLIGGAVMSTQDALACSDAVVIATPTDTHATLVSRALEAGLAVLVEKPICTTTDRAHQLAQIAERKAVVLATGHSERFNPAVRSLSLATERDPIVSLVTSRSMPRSRAPRGSITLNLAVHDLDLARFLSRSRVEVAFAHGDSDRVTIGTTLHGASFGEHAVWQRAPARARTLSAATASGARYEADLLTSRLTVDGLLLAVSDEEPLLAQARAFLRAVATGDMSSLATADDAASAVSLALEAEALSSYANPHLASS